MKISLQRSGGLAGIPMIVEVDSAMLPPAKAAELEMLARDAVGEPAAHGNAPDAYQYDVTIDGAVHHWTDVTLTDSGRALIDWLTTQAR